MPVITWDSSNKGTNVTLSNDNLIATCATATGSSVKATQGYSSGKYYWEITASTIGHLMVGVALSTFSTTGTFIGNTSDSYGYYYANGCKYNLGLSTSYGATYTTGDVIGIALDLDDKTLTFYKNGILQGTAYTNLPNGVYYAVVSNVSSDTSISIANFGATSFKYSIPSGFIGYGTCMTKYLIQDKSSVLYTYNGTDIIQCSLQTLNDNNFISNGFNDATIIPESVWNAKFPNKSDVKILLWTDDIDKKEAKMTYECEPFELVNWLKNDPCKLIVYTDDLEKKECEMIYNCDPYKPLDRLEDEFDIMMLK